MVHSYTTFKYIEDVEGGRASWSITVYEDLYGVARWQAYKNEYIRAQRVEGQRGPTAKFRCTSLDDIPESLRNRVLKAYPELRADSPAT